MLVLPALAWGAVGMPWRALTEMALFLGLALALTAAPHDALRPVARPAFLLAAAAFWGLVQSMPWPAAWVGLLAPATARAWTEAQGLLGADTGWMPVSLAPEASRTAFLLWLAGAAALALGGLLGRFRGLRRLALWALSAGASFQVLFGAGAWLRRDPVIWGLDVPGDPSRLRGTFVNPDHLALHLALALTCATAWSWWALRKARHGGMPIERRLMLPTAPLLLVALLFAGIAFTGSRAGLLAAVAALATQGLVLALRHRRWQMASVTLVSLAVGLGTVGLIGWRQGFARWFETSTYELTWNARLAAWPATIELWASSPVVGVGLGAFEAAFPRVQPATLPGTWTHAHSDVLETLATGGLVLVPCLVLAAWLTMRRLWLVLRRGRRSEDRTAALAAWGALAAAFFHSCVDFGLTMPANSLALLLVCGLALGTPTLQPRPAAERRTHMLPRDADVRPVPVARPSAIDR